MDQTLNSAALDCSAGVVVHPPARSPGWFSAVRIILAVILIVAASLKAYLLITDPLAAIGLPGPRWFIIIAIEAEFLLGTWLLTGLFPTAARQAALLGFGLLAVISLYKGISGQASCGCFGKITVSPWFTFVLDLVAVAALLVFRNGADPPSASPARTTRFISLGTMVLAVLFALFGGVAMAKPAWQPRTGVAGLVCEQPIFDFGAMAQRAAGGLQHRFVLKNTSNRAIRITKTEASCGCTGTTVTDQSIESGQSAELVAKVDWSAKGGSQLVKVTVRTDSAETPWVLLTLQGDVHLPIALSPASLNFGLMRPGEVKTRIVEVSPGTNREPFRIVNVSSTGQHISISRVGPDDKQSQELLQGPPGRFAITLAAPRQQAREESTVAFHTNLNGGQEILLPIAARYAGAIVAEPASLFFGADKGVLLKQKIHVAFERSDVSPKVDIVWDARQGTNPFSVEKIEPEATGSILTVAFKRNEAGSMCRCFLHVRSGQDELDVPVVAVSR